MKRIMSLVMCILISSVTAEIIEIHQIKEFKDVVGPLKNSEWVLFDIDYTLTEPSEPALQMNVIKQNKQRFKDELAKFTPEQRQVIPGLMVTHTPNQLTDPLVPSLIQNLQDNGITVIGFTAIDTGVIPGVGSAPIWRAKELKRLGIEFSGRERIEFMELPSFRGVFPLYQDGILYANVIPSKGVVLAAFLANMPQKPSRIILVDDTLENLESVEVEMRLLGIPFLGLHYRVQVDESKSSQVSEDQWRKVWDEIHERAMEVI